MIKVNRKIIKLISIITAVSLILNIFSPLAYLSRVYAASDAPDQPSQPDQPEQPDRPEQPDEPEEPDQPDEPDQPESPDQPEQPDQPVQPGDEEEPAQTETETETQSDPESVSNSESTNNDEPAVNSGSQEESGNMGETTIETGDANAIGSINNNVNTNISASSPNQGSSGTNIVNDGNGSGSSNVASSEDNVSTSTIQTNSAVISNEADFSSNSGSNTIKDNTGGSVTIDTGDANTSLTVVNQANTNIAGADIAEFNVVEDYMGDLVLDFENPCSTGGCVAGAPVLLANSNNGADSQNTITDENNLESSTFQENEAVILNDIVLESDSGNNQASRNTGGDVTIETGDANVSANVVNFANNNLAGNVIVGIVNIFGDLIGDIIIPESAIPDGVQFDLANMNNGSESDNFLAFDNDLLNQMVQQNEAMLTNNLELDADTGNNSSIVNTGGNTEIETGEASVMAQILNVANTNIIGGDWWLILVNQAGNWFGKIIGAPQGSNFAGSPGTQFSQASDGSLTAMNSGNGSDSQNHITHDNNQENTTQQQNVAEITNNLSLSANTGGNIAADNTGGNIDIDTGDANIIASIVNFVNNNIIGGKVYLTVVNVFGSWVGDILPPGATKDSEPENPDSQEIARGGDSSQTGGGATNSSNDSSSSSESDDQDEAVEVTGSINDLAWSSSSFLKPVGFLVSGPAQDEGETGSTAQVNPIEKGKRIVKFNLAPLILFITLLVSLKIGRITLPLLLAKFKK